MDVVLYTDETTDIPLESLASGLNAVSSGGIKFTAERGPASIKGARV